jgi:hypothetical protein
MGLLTGGGGPILGAIGGAIHPTPGLSVGQSIVHGLLSGVPAYRILGTLSHLFTGTAGQWGDPANNPFTRSAGNEIPTMPATTVTPDPAQSQPATAGPSGGGPGTPQTPLDMARIYNSLRGGQMPTWQQLMNPGSAIGPFGGGNTNPYDPNNWSGPRWFDHSMGPEAQALMAILSKMQP